MAGHPPRSRVLAACTHGGPPRHLAYSAMLVMAVLLCVGWASAGIYRVWHARHVRQQRADRAVELAVAYEAQWREYFLSHKAWPDPRTPSGRLSVVRDGQHPERWDVISHWLSEDDNTFMVIDSVHRDGELSLSSAPAPGAVVWTTDGGKTWHCGPYNWAHADDFPAICRESGAPRAYSPFGWVS